MITCIYIRPSTEDKKDQTANCTKNEEKKEEKGINTSMYVLNGYQCFWYVINCS